MRDAQEEKPYDLLPTPDVRQRLLRLWVNESFLDGDTVTAPGTLLKDFLRRAPRGDALARGYGSYVLTDTPGEAAQGWLSFYFAQAAAGDPVPFRVYRKVLTSHYWPPVLVALTQDIINRYIEDGGGATFGERLRSQGTFINAYSGPTLARVEEYWSPTKFVIPPFTSPQPESMEFDYGAGVIRIDECLHPIIIFEYSTGSDHPQYPLLYSGRTFLATNMTSWPLEMVIEDDQAPRDGGWLRRRVVAYNPMYSPP